MSNAPEILGRIQQYLALGGFFNPDAMEHDKVQRMVMDARDKIHALSAELAEATPHLRLLARLCECCQGSRGFIDENDNEQECPYCKPIWSLIERIEPPKPKAATPPIPEEVDDDIVF